MSCHSYNSYIAQYFYDLPKMSRKLILHLTLSAVGVVVGISAFFVISVFYGNQGVGFWSILSGILAGVCFHLHWITYKGTIGRWYTEVTLRGLNVIGFLGAVTGITALIWYMFVTLYYKIPIKPISESTAITAVWSMMCGKWGIFLMYYSNKYELIIQGESSSVWSENSA